MRKIGVNFVEKAICILTDSQQGVELRASLGETRIKSLAPDKFRHRTCLMWDFEAHTCTVCEDYVIPDFERADGVILSTDNFAERPDTAMPCDTTFEELMDALELEETDMDSFWDELIGRVLG